MNKEEILARSRSEAVDEGLREAESRGATAGDYGVWHYGTGDCCL